MDGFLGALACCIVIVGLIMGLLLCGAGIVVTFIDPPSTSQQSVVDHGCAEWHTVEIVDGKAVVEFRWLHEQKED